MITLLPYRLVTGSQYCDKCDAFHFVAHHMTYYAADRHTLMILLTMANAPLGKIFLARDVEVDGEAPFAGLDAEPSAN